MPKCDISFPIPLPDDPYKWEGWNNYRSTNYYERLCLDPRSNPSNELIEEHCRELLRWWQRKLPLKNQPSNPIAQLLRAGLDESSRYLTQARVELLDPERRRIIDEEIAEQEREEAVLEFEKYVAFTLADGTLTADEEKNLIRFGMEHGLTQDVIVAEIDAKLLEKGAQRIQAPPPTPPSGALQAQSPESSTPQEEFLRMLRLSGLDSLSMSDDQRDTFIDMAENLGLDPGEAEDLVDLYLEEADEKSQPSPRPQPIRIEPKATEPKDITIPHVSTKPAIEINPAVERKRYPNFKNSLGMEMLLVPSGEFVMGSDSFDASPHERPLARVTISRFYMSRYLVSNAVYEQFEPSHSRKRMRDAGDRYPVVYVSSFDAIRFCQWLSIRERKRYRLPTEAQWEYAARGTDGRRYPWGNYEGRGDLANFADRNTVFAWSDRDIDDGYAETSPVGAYPLGASAFGMEDMAGNVWEWCSDYFASYTIAPKVNPTGPASGTRRVYRGGSWKSRFNSLRATVRNSNVPTFSCNDLGFRIICECD
ncbi:MAG TPA: formylglycine-generating enzyme family protein [Chthoniobacterales bacterium]|jgi:formylglycine-generating enzyme required for sulfatase activity|nr:formylglycine-generating enzyme family protein [Chthoniobacterales bacterium]